MAGTYSKYGSFINKQDVRRDIDPAFVALEGDLSLSRIQIYISSSGNDDNDGLTSENAVLTWNRAWEIAGINSNIVVHVIGTITDSYVQPPTNARWVIITGDNNFTEVASGVAGGSTTAIQLELASAASEDEYRHFTIEFTSGAAAGYRRTIRNNSTTIVKPVHAFENFAGAITPAPGDNYRIIRPSSKITLPFDNGGGTSRYTASLSDNARVDLINISLLATSTGVNYYDNYLHPAPNGMWFGVLIEGLFNLSDDFGLVVSGADDAAVINKVSDIIDLLSISGYAHGQWHGWGLGFLLATFTARGIGISSSSFAPTTNGFFYGFITCAQMFVGNAYIRGGSCFTMITASVGKLILSVGTLDASFARPAIPLLIKNNYVSSAIFTNNGARHQYRYTIASTNIGIEMQLTGNINIAAGIIACRGGSIITSETGIAIDYSGTTNAPIFYSTTGGVIRYGTDTYATWTTPNARLVRCSQNSNISGGVFNFSGALGVLNVGGYVEFTSTNTITCTGRVWEQSAGQSIISANTTCIGNDASAMLITGGTFIQQSGTFSCTNGATGANDVLVCKAGATATILGGAGTVLDGSAGASGYGINARGGGRVWCVAQPSGAVGTTADLTVGVGVGEDQPDTALSASLSSLVSTDTLSAIARST